MSNKGAVRVAVLTVSDRGAAGQLKDTSGDAIARWAEERGYELVGRDVVADETDQICAALLDLTDTNSADLVVTTGGSGLGPRDVTPEATRAVVEKDAPGVSEAIRAAARASFPRASLSRGISGIRGRSLIVNLPGSTSGVNDGLAVLSEIVDHAVQILRGEPTDH